MILDANRLDALLERIPTLRIVVLGDFFLDKYLVTNPQFSETSVETGLEARQVVQIRTSPGAAGTVTNNLAALGVGSIEAVGAIGHDGEGWDLLQQLAETRVDTSGLIVSKDIMTPTYCKPMVQGDSQEIELERLDTKNRETLPRDIEEAVIGRLDVLVRSSPKVDAIIVADQVDPRNCGVIMDTVRAHLTAIAKAHPHLLIFADSRSRIGEFQGITLKPNHLEAARATGGSANHERSAVEENGRKLASVAGRPAFVTAGPMGICVCTPDAAEWAPAVRVSGPTDIVGAGDSATAGIVCALAAGATNVEAAALGNMCAWVTIRKLGTTGTASPVEVRRAFDEWSRQLTSEA